MKNILTLALLLLLLLLIAIPAMANETQSPAPQQIQAKTSPPQNIEVKVTNEIKPTEVAKIIADMENRLSTKLENETDRTARWVESERSSLAWHQGIISIFLTVFAIVLTVGGVFIGLMTFRKYDQFVIQLNEKKKEVEQIAASCNTIHHDLQKEYESLERIESDRTPEIRLSQADEKDLEAIANSETAPMNKRQAAKALLAENRQDWSEALNRWQVIILDEPSAENHFRLAYCAQNLANKTPEHVHAMLPLAAKHYEESTNIKPTANTFLNWGNIFVEMTKTTDDPATRKLLLNKAYNKYQSATKINPSHADALFNWGITCCEMAKAMDNPKEKDRLFNEACNKYQSATEVPPSHPDVFVNWAITYEEMAEATNNTTRKKQLLNKACKRYQKATEVDPSHANAFVNWGNVFTAKAETTDNPVEKRQLLNEACKRYQSALKIKPLHVKSFSNLGVALINIAKVTDDPEQKKQLFTKAYNKCQSAILIEPNHTPSFFNQACLLALQNDDKYQIPLRRALELNTAKTYKYMRTDADFDSVRHTREFQALLKEFCKPEDEPQ